MAAAGTQAAHRRGSRATNARPLAGPGDTHAMSEQRQLEPSRRASCSEPFETKAARRTDVCVRINDGCLD